MSSKILVVDDEEDLQILIKAKFRQSIRNNEFEFFFASNGLEALNILEGDPDLNIILTDINMPVMNGLTLLEKLSNTKRLYKAVVVSAYGDMPNIRAAMNLGASDFITKPINFLDFEATIKKMINEYVLLKEAMQAANHLKDIQIELDIARTIQMAMLPSNFNPLPKFPQEIAGKMIPAKEVGGDYFDVFPLDDKRIGLFIADVSGKSISACLFMVATKSLLRAFAQKSNSCGDIMNQVNTCLCVDNQSSMFVTAFFAILDVTTGILTYCNAGHNYPYVISVDGTLKEIGVGHGIPLGVSDDPKLVYNEMVIALKDKECLFLYTDGVTEAMNFEGQMFNRQRLEQVLMQSANLHADEIVTNVIDSLRNFVKSAPQSDDITMLSIRYIAPSSR